MIFSIPCIRPEAKLTLESLTQQENHTVCSEQVGILLVVFVKCAALLGFAST
jgi:hypothetical protein